MSMNNYPVKNIQVSNRSTLIFVEVDLMSMNNYPVKNIQVSNRSTLIFVEVDLMSMNNYPVKNIQVTIDMISYLLCSVVFICLRFLMSFILLIVVARTLVNDTWCWFDYNRSLNQ